MNRSQQLSHFLLRSCTLLLLAALTLGCKPPAKGTSDEKKLPAHVDKVVKETSLNTIELTADAERRIGITTVAAKLQPMARVRTYGGEITLPPGAAIIVSAPVAGTLVAPPDRGVPKIGTQVLARQPTFLLLPLLSTSTAVLSPAERIRYAEARNSIATSRIDAQGQVQQAEVQVRAAQIAMERAERLLREQAGTARAVDDAQAQLNLAKEGLDAAKARKSLLDKLDIEDDPAKLKPLTIESPQPGILRALHVAAGEVVAAGAPLFEVMDGQTLWVKVPIYVGELSALAADKPAEISAELPNDPAARVQVSPIAAPPTATALASTVDLYYALKNTDGKWRPAQRVDVAIKLRDERDSLVIPWSAVVHDIQGGTWVYERTAERTYVRRRVQIRYVSGQWGVLDRGLQAGAEVVSTSVMELFGTEFGFAK